MKEKARMRRLQKYARVLAPAVAIVTGAILVRAQEAPSGQQQQVAQVPPDQQQPQDQRGRGFGRRGGFGRGGPQGDAAATQPSAPGLNPDGTPATQPAIPAPTNQPVTVYVPSTTQASKELSLNFRDMPLDDVLSFLSRQGGFTIIKQGQMEGRITLVSIPPVSPEQAVALLNTALRVNNYAAIQHDKILKVLPLAEATRADPKVRVGANPEDVPNTDELYTWVIPLKSVDANKLKTELAPLISPNIAADQGSNTLVITDAASNIRRVIEIVAAMDTSGISTSEIWVKTLKYASASSTAKLITTIFPSANANQQQQGGFPFGPGGFGGRGGRGGGFGPGGGGNNASAEVDEALHSGHVTASSDDRTNSLVIVAPKETIKLIENLVEKLDENPMPTMLIKAFPLKYADAEATTKLLTTLFSSSTTGGGFGGFIGAIAALSQQDQNKIKVTVAADDRTNTVIVTAPQEAMTEIEKLIVNLDSNPVANSVLKIFPFKYGSASGAAKLITTIFAPDDSTTSGGNTGGGGGGGRGGARRFFGFAGGGNQSTASTSSTQKITASSEDTTNTLVVSAPADVMKLIEGIVTQLDTNPASEQTMFIYRLRNAQSANLQNVLNVLFGNSTNGTGSLSSTGNRSTTGSSSSNRGSTGFGGGGSTFGGGGSSLGGGGIGGGGGLGGRSSSSSSFGSTNRNNTSTANRSTGLSNFGGGAGSNQQRAISALSGEVFVVADQDTNSLLVTAPIKYKEQVENIIASLDHPIPQVLIKVLVAEVTHDNSADFGVDFSVLNQRPSGKGIVVGQTLGNTAAYAANGGLAVSLLEGNLQATLHALATQGKLDVLSRPYILASDNQEATISVGQEVPIVTDVRETALGQLVATPTYQQVGITLDVTPHINPDGLVILDVAPSIIQLTASNIQIAPGVNSPIFDQRTAQSRVGIRNDETIVIGGLMEDKKTVNVSKIPLLGDIPLIGAVFSRTQIGKTKTELLIFLTPHVALQPGLLRGMSESEGGTLKLMPNAVEPGTYQEHIRNMGVGAMPQTRPAYPGASNPVTDINIETPAEQPNPNSVRQQPSTRPNFQSSAPRRDGPFTGAPIPADPEPAGNSGATGDQSSAPANQSPAPLPQNPAPVDSQR